MVDILINLINDMRICLAISFGIGLISGYLYTKLRAREIYKPELDRLIQKIASQEIEADTSLNQNSTANAKLQEEENNLQNGTTLIKKFKNDISDLEATKTELDTKNIELKEQFLKLNNNLRNKNSEIQSLKSALGVEDLSKIEARKKNLKSDISNYLTNYKQKCDSYDGLFNEDKELHTENSNLKSKLLSLTTIFNKKELELSDITKHTQDLRTKLQREFDLMIQNKEENISAIQRYKNQLLEIKKKLSS